MRLKLKNQSVTLKTKDKYLTEDIELLVDGSLINNQDDRLKKYLDTTQSCYYAFRWNKNITSIDGLLNYSDTENVVTMMYMFQNCYALKTIPLLDTSKVTNMGYMFNNCSSLETIPLLNTNNVTDMNNMFNGCPLLESIPLLDTSNVTNMGYMFYNCDGLQTIKLLNTSNVTNMGSTFNSCRNIKKIDISCYKIASTSNSSSFCYQCYKLKAFIIRSFGETYVLNSNAFDSCYFMLGKTNLSYNPAGEQGYVYVPRDMISILSNETNWSTLSFRALEDYTIDGTCEGEFDDEKAGL